MLKRLLLSSIFIIFASCFLEKDTGQWDFYYSRTQFKDNRLVRYCNCNGKIFPFTDFSDRSGRHGPNPKYHDYTYVGRGFITSKTDSINWPVKRYEPIEQ